MDAEARARRIIDDGEEPSAEDLKTIAATLRDEHETKLIAELLTVVARRALRDEWDGDRAALAIDVLRDHQQFGYARRLLSRVRTAGPDDERLRQQHALVTYKDLEVSARRRLDRALEILGAGGTAIEDSTNAETLGIAGAIYKRRWEVDAKRADLENALWCYERGFEQEQQPERWYAGVNAAFVADRLAWLEDAGLGTSPRAAELRDRADAIRRKIADEIEPGDRGWNDATLGEALFGLGEFDQACAPLARVAEETKALWRQETTAMQLASLAQLRGYEHDEGARKALAAFVGGHVGAVRRGAIGKVGVALSGGGFRASLFHIGVLARLAECNVLRRVEVLSCVSGGSILGAFYYLKLRELLQEKADAEISDTDYVTLVQELITEFRDGVSKNLRVRLGADIGDDVKMLFTKYSRTDRAGELFEELFYSRFSPPGEAWRMRDLLVTPHGREQGFSLRYENWLREAKVPILVLNATTLNTGHAWQFTATWMGEPPIAADERVDASRRLRRLYYWDAPPVEDLQNPALGKAVAASACVPMLFPPITFEHLYDDEEDGSSIDVELVDGGVHDNQGIQSLVEQDCTVILVSDASGQLRDDEDPKRLLPYVATRSNSILMKRVRGAQYGELYGRVRSGTLRGFMAVHLTKGLPAPPRNWSTCQEPWTPEDDAIPPTGESPYGFDPGVQRALAELRTDLDAFSDDEAYTLMAAGYRMTERDLGKPGALPGLDQTVVAGDWPFAQHLARMTADDASDLAESLEPGNTLFFRKPKSRLKRWAAKLAALRDRR